MRISTRGERTRARHSPPLSGPTPPRWRRAGTSGTVADLLVDTDVFIDHLRGSRELDPGRHRLHYSVITRAELFAGTTATNAVTMLLGPFREIAVDRITAERAEIGRASCRERG